MRNFILTEPSLASIQTLDDLFIATSYTGRVEYLSDGDTIGVRSGSQLLKVRMLGIDTPELHFHGQKQSPWAEAALDYLSGLIPPGTQVRLLTDLDEHDKYGRLLAYVMLGQQNINLEMVRSGWAAPYQIYPNLRFLEPMQAASAAAHEAGLGIFNPGSPLPLLPYEFRQQVEHRQPDKFCGDVQTRLYYPPLEYRRVQVTRRVFFFTEADAKAFGYSPAPIPFGPMSEDAHFTSRLRLTPPPPFTFGSRTGPLLASREAGVMAVAEPRILSTSDWGARPPRRPITVLNHRPTSIVVHHTTHDNTSDFSQQRALIVARGIQNFHMTDPNRRWIDTGQHFTVSRGGFILEGRHRSLEVARRGQGHVLGAHAGDRCNSTAIGIENEGSYGEAVPPSQQRRALVELCAWLCRQYGIAPSSIRGHRECKPTACPGDALFAQLPALRLEVSQLIASN